MTGFRLFLLLFAACIAVAALGGSWLWSNYGGDVTAEFERIERDAQEFAAANEQDDCVPEAFGRLEVCDGVWCKVQTPLFTRECLRRATPSPELCDSVPDSLPAALLWPTTTCADIDAEPEICQRILRELVTVCFASESP
jgi:hypothetical protein